METCATCYRPVFLLKDVIYLHVFSSGPAVALADCQYGFDRGSGRDEIAIIAILAMEK